MNKRRTGDLKENETTKGAPRLPVKEKRGERQLDLVVSGLRGFAKRPPEQRTRILEQVRRRLENLVKGKVEMTYAELESESASSSTSAGYGSTLVAASSVSCWFDRIECANGECCEIWVCSDGTERKRNCQPA